MDSTAYSSPRPGGAPSKVARSPRRTSQLLQVGQVATNALPGEGPARSQAALPTGRRSTAAVSGRRQPEASDYIGRRMNQSISSRPQDTLFDARGEQVMAGLSPQALRTLQTLRTQRRAVLT